MTDIISTIGKDEEEKDHDHDVDDLQEDTTKEPVITRTKNHQKEIMSLEDDVVISVEIFNMLHRDENKIENKIKNYNGKFLMTQAHARLKVLILTLMCDIRKTL